MARAVAARPAGPASGIEADSAGVELLEWCWQFLLLRACKYDELKSFAEKAPPPGWSPGIRQLFLLRTLENELENHDGVSHRSMELLCGIGQLSRVATNLEGSNAANKENSEKGTDPLLLDSVSSFKGAAPDPRLMAAVLTQDAVQSILAVYKGDSDSQLFETQETQGAQTQGLKPPAALVEEAWAIIPEWTWLEAGIDDKSRAQARRILARAKEKLLKAVHVERVEARQTRAADRKAKSGGSQSSEDSAAIFSSEVRETLEACAAEANARGLVQEYIAGLRRAVDLPYLMRVAEAVLSGRDADLQKLNIVATTKVLAAAKRQEAEKAKKEASKKQPTGRILPKTLDGVRVLRGGRDAGPGAQALAKGGSSRAGAKVIDLEEEAEVLVVEGGHADGDERARGKHKRKHRLGEEPEADFFATVSQEEVYLEMSQALLDGGPDAEDAGGAERGRAKRKGKKADKQVGATESEEMTGSAGRAPMHGLIKDLLQLYKNKKAGLPTSKELKSGSPSRAPPVRKSLRHGSSSLNASPAKARAETLRAADDEGPSESAEQPDEAELLAKIVEKGSQFIKKKEALASDLGGSSSDRGRNVSEQLRNSKVEVERLVKLLRVSCQRLQSIGVDPMPEALAIAKQATAEHQERQENVSGYQQGLVEEEPAGAGAGQKKRKGKHGAPEPHQSPAARAGRRRVEGFDMDIDEEVLVVEEEKGRASRRGKRREVVEEEEEEEEAEEEGENEEEGEEETGEEEEREEEKGEEEEAEEEEDKRGVPARRTLPSRAAKASPVGGSAGKRTPEKDAGSLLGRKKSARQLMWESQEEGQDSGGLNGGLRLPSPSGPARLSPISARTQQVYQSFGRRKMHKWSQQETNALIAAVRRYGQSWSKILQECPLDFEGRTQVDLKDKYRVLVRNGTVTE